MNMISLVARNRGLSTASDETSPMQKTYPGDLLIGMVKQRGFKWHFNTG